MKIASTLLNWLPKPAPQAEADPAQIVQDRQTVAPSPPQQGSQDSVRFSPLAQKLSQTQGVDLQAQISPAERLALQEQFQPQTYKPSLMQLAHKFLGLKN
jgi:pyruvate/2-oxoglutarate dehydrogenase complex dihydrolipoamide acyltransferase (E2) component